MWRLRGLLSLQNILIAALPLLVLVIAALGWIIPQLRTEVERNYLSVAQVISRQVATYLKESERELSIPMLYMSEFPHAGTHWQEVLDKYYLQKFTNILVVNRAGVTVAVGLRPTLQGERNKHLGTDVSRRAYFQQAKISTGPFWSDIFLSTTTGQPAVALVMPLAEGGYFIGELDLSELSHWVKETSQASDETIMLLDRKGVLVAHPDSALSNQQLTLRHLPVVSDALEGKGVSRVQTFSLQNQELTGVAVKIDEIDWLVLVAQPPNVAYWLINLTVNALTIAIVVALFASVIGGVALARYQAKRIGWYEDIAGKIAQGQFAIDWPKSKIEEFSSLIADLKSMAKAIQTREDAVLRQRDQLSLLRDQLEKTVEQRTADLKQANKELESFSYSVSHDLRAPLRSLDGFSSILLEEYSQTLDRTGTDYLNRIKRASNRMGELIDDLLQLSRISQYEINKEIVNLSDLARSEIAAFKKLDSGRQIEVVIHPTDPVRGDPRLLSIALNNLLGNAWKYTSKTKDPYIEFGAERLNGEAVFYVRDNGVGFDMSYSEKLFGAFQRLHSEKQFPGTGIGLATVKRVINRHGGKIWVDAAPEKGATFFFTLRS